MNYGETLIALAPSLEDECNWRELIKIYKDIIKKYDGDNLSERRADIFMKLGFYHARLAETAVTSEKFVSLYELSSIYYKNAGDLFKKKNNEPREIECKAEVLFNASYISSSFEGAKELTKKAFQSFLKASEIYSTKGLLEDKIRTLGRAAYTSSLCMYWIDNLEDIRKAYEESREIVFHAWKLSIDNKMVYYFPDILFAFGFISFIEYSILPFNTDSDIKENIDQAFSFIQNSWRLIENCKNLRVLSHCYYVIGTYFGTYGFFFSKNEIEQNQYAKIAISISRKGISLIRKIKDIIMLLCALHWFNFYAMLFNEYEIVQERIMGDVEESLELVGMFKSLKQIYTIWPYYATTMLVVFYYSNMSLMSFLPIEKRMKYAKKGIEHSLDFINNTPELVFNYLPYRHATSCYSLLVNLTSDETEKEHFSKEMLAYAKKAKSLGDRYEGGLAKAAGYSSLYTAYKTLSENALGVEEKKQMLNNAIEAHEKYIDYAIESRSGVIRANIKLANLYEEIGILSNISDKLMKAKNVLLKVLKDCKEKGYLSDKVAALEYLARIEDRLGNYYNAAGHYLEAQKIMENSVDSILYPPLKKRVKDKIKYIKAWNLIQLAKLKHNKEDHSESRKLYQQASEILNSTKSFKYESSYYAAWTLLEESELFSKQEKYEKAKEKYLKAKECFQTAIHILNEHFDHSRDEHIKKKIHKLRQAANSRISYCNARINLEKGRLLKKKGEHLEAARFFSAASLEFKKLCKLFKDEKEKFTLEATYLLCRAWESMELAEQYQDSEKFVEAALLFEKASHLLPVIKMKMLTLGNSAFCSALELGTKFDNSLDFQFKAELYPRIKLMLRKASNFYNKGGFNNAANWALATSTHFDAAWNLIKADIEQDLDIRQKHLEISSKMLESALKLFNQTGYRHKEKEVHKLLEMIKQEKTIIITALNTIQEPSESNSMTGIIAPACPIESSLSPNMAEVQKLSVESQKYTSSINKSSSEVMDKLSKMESRLIEVSEYVENVLPKYAPQDLHQLFIVQKTGVTIYSENLSDIPDDKQEEKEIYLGGVLAAVQTLLNQLTENKEPLKEVKKEGYSILIEEGDNVFLAIISKQDHPIIRKKMEMFLEKFERKFENLLKEVVVNTRLFLSTKEIVKEYFRSEY